MTANIENINEANQEIEMACDELAQLIAKLTPEEKARAYSLLTGMQLGKELAQKSA